VHGPAAFADNAQVEVRIVDAFGTILPIAVVEPGPDLAAIDCAPTAPADLITPRRPFAAWAIAP